MKAVFLLAAALTASLVLVASSAAAPPTAREVRADVNRLEAELSLLSGRGEVLGIRHRSSLVHLAFRNRDGYKIDAFGMGQTVALAVTRGRRSGTSTTYLAHGRVTPTALVASFADRGRIDVRLHPSGDVLRVPRRLHCAAAGHVIGRSGVFVGSIHFRGEGGYTSADVHRVSGVSVDLGALFACSLGVSASRHRTARARSAVTALRRLARAAGRGRRGVPGVRTHPSGRSKVTELVADRTLALRRTVFAAESRPGHAFAIALDEHSEGSIAIARLALKRVPPATFAFDNALSTAGVTPPRPFSGSATFLRGLGGARSWTGSLAVSFPGAPNLALTGTGFHTWLTRSW